VENPPKGGVGGLTSPERSEAPKIYRPGIKECFLWVVAMWIPKVKLNASERHLYVCVGTVFSRPKVCVSCFDNIFDQIVLCSSFVIEII
jgi:hypothetical protein